MFKTNQIQSRPKKSEQYIDQKQAKPYLDQKLSEINECH